MKLGTWITQIQLEIAFSGGEICTKLVCEDD